MIEGTDGLSLHAPEGGRLGTEQQGRGTPAGTRIAVDEGRFDVVEIEDSHVCGEAVHQRHHLLVFDLQKVDPFLVGSLAERLDHRGAPEPPRGDAPRRRDLPGQPARPGLPGHRPDVDAEIPETVRVRGAVVVAAEDELAQLGQPAGNGEGTLVAAVVVRQREELRHHEGPHRSALLRATLR